MVFNKEIQRLFDESTTILTGWDDYRGNMKTPYLDRTLLVNKIVDCCLDQVENHMNCKDQPEWQQAVNNIKEFFSDKRT